jgi:hypothetical protein
VPLRFIWEYDDDGNETSVSIQPWDADEWTGPDSDDEYVGSWWCVDDPFAYQAKTPLYQRMRGTIEQVIGVADFEALAKELDRRAATVSPMPILGKGIAEGRELIPLAVQGKTLERPAPLFEQTWEGKLDICK